MDIHDYIADELFRIKSVAACIYLLERGRELEFTYNNKEYFMSGDGSAKSYSLWLGKEEQAFDSMEALLPEADIETKKLYQVWADIKLEMLY